MNVLCGSNILIKKRGEEGNRPPFCLNESVTRSPSTRGFGGQRDPIPLALGREVGQVRSYSRSTFTHTQSHARAFSFHGVSALTKGNQSPLIFLPWLLSIIVNLGDPTHLCSTVPFCGPPFLFFFITPSLKPLE